MADDLNLSKIKHVCKNINTMPAKYIRLLHDLIFEKDNKRKNRSELREFTGFTFKIEDSEYNSKLQRIKEKFSEGDIVIMCSVLCIDYDKEEDELELIILKYLMDLKLFQQNQSEDEENDDEQNSLRNDGNNEENGTGCVDGCCGSFHCNDDMGNDRSKKSSKVHFSGCSISFRDVEESIRKYEGKDDYPVDTWIIEFEEIAELMEWNSLQKFVFAKKSLTGIARSFIMSERGLNSYVKLIGALKVEFSRKTSVAKLHKVLSMRKLKKGESVHEYFICMKEIANRGPLDDETLIQYVIEGINDVPTNKIILYGARNLNEFKQKLRDYSMFKETENIKEYVQGDNFRKSVVDLAKKIQVKCYNCGEEGHKSNNCTIKSLGTKCFKCGTFGHISKNCKDCFVQNNENQMLCVFSQNELEDRKVLEAEGKMKVLEAKVMQLTKDLSSSERAKRVAETERNELLEEISANVSKGFLMIEEKRRLEARITDLEEELEGEQLNSEVLHDRNIEAQLTIEQLTTELASEKSNTEKNKNIRALLERQNKDLKVKLTEAKAGGKMKPEDEKMKLGDEKMKLEDEKIKLEDEKMKLENERVKLEDERMKPEDEEMKSEDEKEKETGEFLKAEEKDVNEDKDEIVENVESEENVENEGVVNEDYAIDEDNQEEIEPTTTVDFINEEFFKGVQRIEAKMKPFMKPWRFKDVINEYEMNSFGANECQDDRIVGK